MPLPERTTSPPQTPKHHYQSHSPRLSWAPLGRERADGFFVSRGKRIMSEHVKFLNYCQATKIIACKVRASEFRNQPPNGSCSSSFSDRRILKHTRVNCLKVVCSQAQRMQLLITSQMDLRSGTDRHVTKLSKQG